MRPKVSAMEERSAGTTSSDRTPTLSVTLDRSRRIGASSLCEVVWRVQNLGRERIAIEESWLPHGQFRASRQVFEPALVLATQAALVHTREVELVAAPGQTVENTFLILRVLHQERAWRLFVRMRVEVDSAGGVQPIVETVTAGPIETDS